MTKFDSGKDNSASKPAAPQEVVFTVDCSKSIDDVLPADRRWTIANAIALVAAYRNCASGETKEVMQQFADYMRAALDDAASPAAPAQTLTDEQIVAIMSEIGSCRENDEADHIAFARALLAALATGGES